MSDLVGIFGPKEGWKDHTWYLVDVSLFRGNPVWKALFFSGFLQNGKPCGYSGFFPANCAPKDGSYELSKARYFKVDRELVSLP